MKTPFLRLTLLFCFLLGAVSLALAQPPEDDMPLPENDQIRSQRVAYITQRLNLTPAEAGHFWTAYSEYETQRRALLEQNRPENIAQPRTDAEANELIERRFQLEEDLVALKRRFYDQMRSEVSPRKLVLLPRAEQEFRRELLRRLRERRGN
ncbi:MAG: hypothetical protein KDC54_17010 [Lewinella sp.]|nr:hypothetical protein [Lewinella sp.]